MRRGILALSLLLAAGACKGSTDPVVCPAWVRPAVEVAVYDARTNAAITAGSTLELYSGARLVTFVTVPEDAPQQTVAGIGGAAGTYTVTVRRAGYQPWSSASVKVRKGTCSLETVHLDAYLAAS